MTTNNTPLTDDQLTEYEALIARTTPLGAVTASPGILSALVAEVRRLRAAPLPPPVSRADVYRDAADVAFALDFDELRATTHFDSHRQAWELGTIDVANKLRRMADETQPGTDRLLPDGTVDYDAPPPPATNLGVPLHTGASLDRAADEARTPCSVPNPCEDGELCATHEKEQAHAEGEHAFCGDECGAPE